MWDEQMRSEDGEGAIANTSSLTDELGQVKYIFTDKTGTLTQNRMEFRKCSVDGNVYAAGKEDRTGSRSSSVPSMVERRKNSRDSLTSSASGARSLYSFRGLLNDSLDSKESQLALAMALCHTVVCEKDPNDVNGLRYNSDSPDECALVRGAACMGVKLVSRNGPTLKISVTEESRHKSTLKTVNYAMEFDVLRTIYFSSDRKRMSVIIRDAEGKIKLLCKGADSVILERCEEFLSPKKQTLEHVQQFAVEGYRILSLAERTLDAEYYATWEQRWQEAELDIHFKTKKMDALADEMESKLTLIGATAVEDRLQDGVPETIELFQKAGIKIWVLTGDKLETSLQMGKLCGVVTSTMREVILKASTEVGMAREIDEALGFGTKDPQALIIDGASLTFALYPSNREKFLKLALGCSTVIVCRTSPLQKALVVELVKDGLKCVTLAVGDGANDVSMIRAAHVGVGVMGEEGMQAVRSSDYSIQQFSHLARLLLHHGRLSYMRTAQLINYFFYKNIVFTLPQFFYGCFSLFAGQTFFCDLYISAYNVVFTALPVVARAIMETDLPERIAEKYPELYRSGPADEYFSKLTVLKSSGMAIFHALVVTLMPLAFLHGFSSPTSDGTGADLWSTSVASFFYIVPLVHFQICFETWNWTRFVGVTYVISLLFYVFCVAVYDNFESVIQGVWGHIFFTPIFWLVFVLCVIVCLFGWISITCYEENFMSNHPLNHLRRMYLGKNRSKSMDKVHQADNLPTTPNNNNMTNDLYKPQ